jgi:hypothetical protein
LMVIKNGIEYVDHQGAMVRLFKKYGYKVTSMRDCHKVIINDQLVTTMLYLMCNFINEETKEIISKPYRLPMDLVEANPIFEVSNISNVVKEKLIQRATLLPNSGITAKVENCGEVKELYLKEVIKNETIVLLFRVKFSDGTYTSGYYNTEQEIFYDMWKESSHAAITHVPLENIVLQNYVNLTCNLTKEERNDLVWFKEVRDVDKLSDRFFIKPMVYYEIKEQYEGSKNGGVIRNFDRRKYIADLMNIQPFLRNLPTGANASAEAIKTAKKLGIELAAGKTLVRGFIKKVYVGEKQKEG